MIIFIGKSDVLFTIKINLSFSQNYKDCSNQYSDKIMAKHSKIYAFKHSKLGYLKIVFYSLAYKNYNGILFDL